MQLKHQWDSLKLFTLVIVPSFAEQGGEGPRGSGKKKGKTVALTDFLKPASAGNWADDDVEDSRESSNRRL